MGEREGERGVWGVSTIAEIEGRKKHEEGKQKRGEQSVRLGASAYRRFGQVEVRLCQQHCVSLQA